MLLLRYVYVAALAVWLGGMIVLGVIAAPSIFTVLQAHDVSAGRALAGAVFGDTLRRFHLLSYGALGTLLVALLLMALVGPRPDGFKIRLGLVSVALAVSLYSGIPLTRDIATLQASIGGLPSALPANDPRRPQFDRLHRLSTSLMMVNIGVALVLLYWQAKE